VPERPLVGIATQSLEAIPGQLPACWVMGRRYVNVLTNTGAIPWLIPLLPDDEPTLRAIYERLEGVFLTGGVDVDPATYGEPRHAMCDRADRARDSVEITLIRWALADHKPILGVCRGIQIINVACGGSLHQHLADDRPEGIKHDYFPTATHYTRDYLAHPVRVEAGSRLGGLLGEAEVEVNSMHHQGINRLAAGLHPCAFAPDGLVEGVESTNGQYLIAVQWHPEELAAGHANMRRLFADFVEAARGFRHR
jgi:putative glutamine amidotransferase